MTDKFALDAGAAHALRGFREQVELTDPAGERVGYFIPAREDSDESYEWVGAQITDEELDRRRQETGARTTAEVLKRLTES